ncbi:hypothetical protein LTR95_018108, partial [Oleoguttula sp. CCFEE 5521]
MSLSWMTDPGHTRVLVKVLPPVSPLAQLLADLIEPRRSPKTILLAATWMPTVADSEAPILCSVEPSMLTRTPEEDGSKDRLLEEKVQENRMPEEMVPQNTTPDRLCVDRLYLDRLYLDHLYLNHVYLRCLFLDRIYLDCRAGPPGAGPVVAGAPGAQIQSSHSRSLYIVAATLLVANVSLIFAILYLVIRIDQYQHHRLKYTAAAWLGFWLGSMLLGTGVIFYVLYLIRPNAHDPRAQSRRDTRLDKLK